MPSTLIPPQAYDSMDTDTTALSSKDENFFKNTWRSLEEALHLREPVPPPVPPKDEQWLVKTVNLALPQDQEPDPSFWEKIVLRITSIHSRSEEEESQEEDEEAVPISVPADAALKHLGVADHDEHLQEKRKYFQRMAARCKEKFDEDSDETLEKFTDTASSDELEEEIRLEPKVDPKEMKAAHRILYHGDQGSIGEHGHGNENDEEDRKLFGSWWGCRPRRSKAERLLESQLDSEWEKVDLPTSKEDKRRSLGEQNGGLPLDTTASSTFNGANRRSFWWKHKPLDIDNLAPIERGSTKQDRKATTRRLQALAAAAAYEAMKEYQAHKIRQGKKVSHGEMKAVLAGMAMAEAVKLLESRRGGSAGEDDEQRDETVAEAGSKVLKLFELLR
ncbi:hypothetical protein BGX28_010122 [Mortierella sp. GBA30]|nr:hypothetical protein BGX28_010122 [Mortierella sp. GBA30]